MENIIWWLIELSPLIVAILKLIKPLRPLLKIMSLLSKILKTIDWNKVASNFVVKEVNYDGKILTKTFDNDRQSQFTKTAEGWFKMPKMTIVGKRHSEKLDRIVKYIEQHGNPYPTAHLNKD